ncbi:hypothetical protein IKE71_03380 [Candidatus Saccharibacteria bacterium]|nr:hypothetical protein [Candidatus Saccharibacteria bacterium]
MINTNIKMVGLFEKEVETMPRITRLAKAAEPARTNGPTLRFFGTMNGESESHTNAVFFPDPNTIVFIDSSMLNVYRQRSLIKNSLIKSVYCCITHTHDDHASGAGRLAWCTHHLQPGHELTFLVDATVKNDLIGKLTREGVIEKSTDEGPIYNLMEYVHYGKAWVFNDRYGNCNPRLLKPDWFIGTIPTDHTPRLNGATGFAFKVDGKLIIYSGDTNTIAPFVRFIERTTGQANYDAETPIELYLDVEVRESTSHLQFAKVKAELAKLLAKYPTMRIILMHYEHYTKLAYEVDKTFGGQFAKRISLAEPTSFC